MPFPSSHLRVSQLRDLNPWTRPFIYRRRRQLSQGHSAGAELVVEPRGKARRGGIMQRETQPEGSQQGPAASSRLSNEVIQ